MNERKTASTWPVTLALAVAVSVNAFGCKGRNEGGSVAGPPAETSSKVPADAPLLAMLSEYEAIRALLASDIIVGVADASERLAEHANRSAARAPQSSQSLSAIARSAGSLKEASGRGLSEARVSFGELSRAVVDLLARDATLRAGRWVFECPMASGYKKWVQKTDSIDNPYMGKSMPSCGEQSSWTP